MSFQQDALIGANSPRAAKAAARLQSLGDRWYLGLDIGVGSIGWAVTNDQYQIPKLRGKRALGVRLFSEAETAAERRQFRTARRRLARRKQRLRLLRQILRPVVEQQDPQFFERLREARFLPEHKRGSVQGSKHTLFNDPNYTDGNFYWEFPTIWHLRAYLLEPDGSKTVDIRHYYLAIHHMLKHRGHFLFSGNFDTTSGFQQIFQEFAETLQQFSFSIEPDSQAAVLGILKGKSVTEKAKALQQYVKDNPSDDEDGASAPQCKALCRLLAGGQTSLKQLFGIDADDEDVKYALKESLDENQDKIVKLVGEANMVLLELAKRLYDVVQVDEIMKGYTYLSQAMCAQYRANSAAGHKWVLRSDRSKDAKLKDGQPDKDGIDARQLKGSLGGAVPHQLHSQELAKILENLRNDYPAVSQEDCERIVSLLTFRIPYYIGPLDDSPEHGWMVRKVGQEHTPIRPWNFDSVVDEAKSAKAFIERMTNSCSYLLNEPVLPQSAMLYQEYMILDALNNLTVDGQKLDVPLKQKLFNDLFRSAQGQVTERKIRYWLAANNLSAQAVLGGVDFPFKHQMSTYHDMQAIFLSGDNGRPIDWVERNRDLLDQAVELITVLPAQGERAGKMLRERLRDTLAELAVTDAEIAKLSAKKYQGWGRLSRALLEGLVCGGNTLIGHLRLGNENFMKVLHDQGFVQAIDQCNSESGDGSVSWRNTISQSAAPAPVKRSVVQALSIINELVRVIGSKPAKIFVETTRSPGEKGKRTKSRLEQLKELYKTIEGDNSEAYKELYREGMTNQRLQSKKLFLYFLQEGKCAYSGQPIDLERLESYDIDHIVPRSLLKDDSFDNLVLVKAELNREKSNEHAIPERSRQTQLWRRWRERGFISAEKYKRLTRKTAFSADELAGFVARDLVATAWSNKLLTTILKTQWQDAAPDVITTKASLTTEFRRPIYDRRSPELPADQRPVIKPEFVKCRELNDLHHAKDAYLAIVCGNVYSSVFTNNPRSWVADHQTELGHGRFNMNRFMEYPQRAADGSQVWDLETRLRTVVDTMARNDILLTVRSYDQGGQFWDQNPVSKAAKTKLPLKTSDSRLAEGGQYGGYSGSKGVCFALIEEAASTKRKTAGKPVLQRRIVQVPLAHRLRVAEYLATEYPDATVVLSHIPYKSLLVIDGFPVTVDGITGSSLSVSNLQQLLLDSQEIAYLKRLLKAAEKLSERNSTYQLDSFSGISAEENMRLYNCFLAKLTGPYDKRPAVKNAREFLGTHGADFARLSLREQVLQLCALLPLFQRKPFVSSSADLRLLGGVKNSGNTAIAAKISSECWLVRQSATGLFEERINLLTCPPESKPL